MNVGEGVGRGEGEGGAHMKNSSQKQFCGYLVPRWTQKKVDKCLYK